MISKAAAEAAALLIDLLVKDSRYADTGV